MTRRDTGLSRTTTRLLLVAVVLGIAHHVDHVLRVDHSGWPFRPDVTPFTFSLLAYPVLAFALSGPRRLFWLRWGALAAGTGSTLFAHVLLETPQMQYAMWAYDRSLEPALWDTRNLCGVRSGTLGMIAIAIGMALNIVLVTAVIAMAADGVRRRPLSRTQQIG